MSTSSQVEQAWVAHIFSHPTVQAFTTKHFEHDVSEDEEFQLHELNFAAAGETPTINFFLCLVQRRESPNQAVGAAAGAGTRYTFQVRLEYYLQQTEAASETYRALRDRLEAVDDLVRASLGATWDDTVDYWEGGAPLPVTKVVINEQACWKGGYTYPAFKVA